MPLPLSGFVIMILSSLRKSLRAVHSGCPFRPTFVALITFLFILSRICLLIIQISDLLRFISRQVGLFRKSGLCSFMVMIESLLGETSMRSLAQVFLPLSCQQKLSHWAHFGSSFCSFRYVLVYKGHVVFRSAL